MNVGGRRVIMAPAQYSAVKFSATKRTRWRVLAPSMCRRIGLLLITLTLASSDAAERSRRATPRSAWRTTARRTLCVVTSVNPALAVLSNDYEQRRIGRIVGLTVPQASTAFDSILPKWLFSVVLRPRVLFSIGSMLRAVQMNSPLRHIFDPSCGIAAGVNLLCLWSNAKWPATMVLGWVISPLFWTALGGESPTMPAIPIKHANTLPVNLTDPVGDDAWATARALRIRVGL